MLFLGLVFFVLKSLLGIARQRSRKKFAILTLKPRSHVRILISNVGYSRLCGSMCPTAIWECNIGHKSTDPYGKAMKK